jgi:hypothetical protein
VPEEFKTPDNQGWHPQKPEIPKNLKLENGCAPASFIASPPWSVNHDE